MSKKVFGDRMGPFGEDLGDWLAYAIQHDQDEYDRQSGIEYRISRIASAVGKLTALLCDKGILSVSESLSVAGIGDWEAKRMGVEVRDVQEDDVI
jgi:hypothetical protein